MLRVTDGSLWLYVPAGAPLRQIEVGPGEHGEDPADVGIEIASDSARLNLQFSRGLTTITVLEGVVILGPPSPASMNGVGPGSVLQVVDPPQPGVESAPQMVSAGHRFTWPAGKTAAKPVPVNTKLPYVVLKWPDSAQERSLERARGAVASPAHSASDEVSLVRALLSAGRSGEAVRVAARAEHSHPGPETWFFLGLALAENGDLAPAEATLRRVTAPKTPAEAARGDDYYWYAQSLLARIDEDRDRPTDAAAAFKAVSDLGKPFQPILGSYGRLYWRGSHLREAIQRDDPALSGSSLLDPVVYHLALAQLYLDANDLPKALEHALEAVRLKPSSGEAHAVLGLVYDRRGTAEQAQREYREALSFSPNDALARLGLAVSIPASDVRTREVRHVVIGAREPLQTTVVDNGPSLRETALALLSDPGVVERIFKPQVTTEVAPSGGNFSTEELNLTHRDGYFGDALHDLSFGDRELDRNYRNDRGENRTLGWLNWGAAPNPQTRVLAQFFGLHEERALPGPEQGTGAGPPTPKATTSLSDQAWDLSARYQPDARTYLWFHAGSRATDTVDDRGPGAAASGPSITSLRRSPYHDTAVEVHLDHDWGGGQSTSYHVFAGSSRVDDRFFLYDASAREFVLENHGLRDSLVTNTIQHLYRSGPRLSLVLGVSQQTFRDRTEFEGQGEVVSGQTRQTVSEWLPYTQATYLLGARDLIRFTAQRVHEHGFTPLLLPAEPFLADALPELAGNARATNLEIDYERRFSADSYAKLLAFRSQLDDYTVAPTIRQTVDAIAAEIPQARIQGFGLRYEQRLSPVLSGYLYYTRHAAHVPGGVLPLNPFADAQLGLTYIDPTGSKLFFDADWAGQTWLDGPTDPQHRLSSRVTFNVRLSKEPSVRGEWVFDIQNLLNTRTFYWAGFPAPGRSYVLEYRLRF